MTPPIPPTNQPVDPLVQLTHTVRDAGDVKLAILHLRYWIGIVLVLAALAYGAARAYGWYEGRLAKLELQASALATAKASEEVLVAAAQVQVNRALAQLHADTVKMWKIIYRTKVDTLPVVVTDSAGVQSVVPMAVVSKMDFDSLGAMCERTQHDCASALAGKDTVIEHVGRLLAIADSTASNYKHQTDVVKRANFRTKIGYGGGGFGAGFTTGVVAGRLSCPAH